ncbi:MAG: hypothetical protein JWL71_3778 [Acidobacteria bacterium]|nr:hypothetical protein [Acidobacteriota bacterium]
MATSRAFRLSSAAMAALCLAWPVCAQSLADVAKKEEERRKTTAEPAKVYTNRDLDHKSDGSPAAPDRLASPDTAKDAKSTDTKESAKAKDAGKDKEASQDKDPKEPKEPKDQAYWSGKLKSLQTQLEQDDAVTEAMQARINALTTDAVNRDDPIQRGKLERDRQKAIADLARLTKAVETDKKAIASLLEDARRAGVPPGWLR